MSVEPDAALAANAVKAWRFLYRRGFIEGFGHLSVRLPGESRFLLTRLRWDNPADADDFLRPQSHADAKIKAGRFAGQ